MAVALTYNHRWRIRMNQAASTILLVLLWVLAAGCESQGTKARVHLRVFEVPTQVLRMHTADQNPHRLSDSAYSVSVVSPNALQAMLRPEKAGTRLLTDTTHVINNWPWVTDAWVYSPTYVFSATGGTGAGSGAGSIGVREQGGRLEAQFDYIVNHRSPLGEKLIESKIFYRHNYREGQVLLFHTPADTSGEGPWQHVIAFEITRQPPDVLAFR